MTISSPFQEHACSISNTVSLSLNPRATSSPYFIVKRARNFFGSSCTFLPSVEIFQFQSGQNFRGTLNLDGSSKSDVALAIVELCAQQLDTLLLDSNKLSALKFLRLFTYTSLRFLNYYRWSVYVSLQEFLSRELKKNAKHLMKFIREPCLRLTE